MAHIVASGDATLGLLLLHVSRLETAMAESTERPPLMRATRFRV